MSDPERKASPFWRETLIVVSLGLLLGLVGVAVLASWLSCDLGAHGAQARTVCMGNLHELGGMYLEQVQTGSRVAQSHSGPAMWLELRKSAAKSRRRDQTVLLCPKDDAAHPPRELCSYAGRNWRDFPADAEFSGARPLGACLRHEHGVIVAFETGDVQFIPLEELGLASEDEKVIGPQSKSPLLRMLTYESGTR